MTRSEITTLLVEQENQNLGVLRKQCPLVTLVMHDFFRTSDHLSFGSKHCVGVAASVDRAAQVQLLGQAAGAIVQEACQLKVPAGHHLPLSVEACPHNHTKIGLILVVDFVLCLCWFPFGLGSMCGSVCLRMQIGWK